MRMTVFSYAKYKGRKENKHSSNRIEGNWRWEKETHFWKCLYILVDAWCSPPQNNVSMFFKWIFVRLLMRVPIKLYSLQCCTICLRFRAHIHAQRKITLSWMSNSSHYFLFLWYRLFFLLLSLKLLMPNLIKIRAFLV